MLFEGKNTKRNEAMTISVTYEDYGCAENFKPLGRCEEPSK